MRSSFKLVVAAIVLSTAGAAFAASEPGADAASCALSVMDAPDAPGAESASGTAIPALTPVAVRILTALDSKTATIGACFPIALADPIIIDGVELVPAGASGLGQVVHAAKARAAGKGGELILAARFVEHAGIRIDLRSLEFRKSGKDQLDAALAASAALPLAGYLFSGGNVWVAEGAVASAKVRHTVRIPRAGAEQRDDVNASEGKAQQ
jgi:hypothetical protein